MIRGGEPKRWTAVGGALALLLLAGTALGGIGGGHSFGGGGGGGGGWSGDGDGDFLGWLLYFALRLCFHYPVVGVPLLVGAVVLIVRTKAWAEPRYVADRTARRKREISLRMHRGEDYAMLRASDPNFSRPLFEDFARLLYVRFQECRGQGDFTPIEPYRARRFELPERGDLLKVSEVVVGAVGLREVRSGPRQHVTLEVEAAITELRKGSRPLRLRVRDLVQLGRAGGTLSRAPEALRALGCPACGATLELSVKGECRHCGEVVTDGRFAWQIESWTRLRSDPMSSDATLAHHAPTSDERPSSLLDPDLGVRRRELGVRDPGFSFERFEERVREVFRALNEAWSSKDWDLARPYETDALFDRHRFWIERYRAQGLSNRVDDLEIQRVQVCRIEQDAYFDSITVRIFASAHDYTVRDSDGEVLGGSKRSKRNYSEYWTFVRRIGHEALAPDTASGTCPSCAAPLKVNQAGSCEYCGAHVTSGRFDWVLAAIDQEHEYRG